MIARCSVLCVLPCAALWCAVLPPVILTFHPASRVSAAPIFALATAPAAASAPNSARRSVGEVPDAQPPAARTQPEKNGPRRTAKKAGPSIVWVNQMKSGQSLPPRTQHLTFHSTLVDQDVGYCVYLPPGYETDVQQRYPVIYNLHGNGGNEYTSLEAIRLLHTGIMDGRWPRMIMVLPNGGHSTFYKDSADGRFPIESIFLQELLPCIDREYRTIAKREGRCIEGFSMGGRGATRLAVKHPALFCSLFCQAGNVPHLLETYDETPADLRPGLLLGADRSNWEANDVYALTTRHAPRLRQSLRIQIACGTKDGGHIRTIRDWHQHLLAENIDHTYIELEGLAHKRTEMMQRMQDVWFDYHVESLKRVGTELFFTTAAK